LLEEVVTAYEDYGINSILEASKMRFHESQESKQAGSPDWWRVSFQFIDLIFFNARQEHCRIILGEEACEFLHLLHITF